METGIHELTAAYALDALDVDERAEYEAHLTGCERCRDELASFWETTEALAVAATGPAPPPELRGRILDAARAERQNVVPLERRSRRTAPVLGAVAAIAAAAAIGLGLYAVSVAGDRDEARSALESAQRAQAVLADPGARDVELASGDGRLVVGANGDAVLVLNGMGPAPAGKAYEAWIIEGDTPRPAGVFAGTSGPDVVLIDGSVAPGAVVAVTVEDAAGVDAPTTDPVAASQPV
jgi:anti-sigma factor RsiW